MKNRILTIVFAAMAVLGLSSCNDYLTRNPLDSNSDATNWTSEDAIQNYSWNFYAYFYEMSYGSGWTKGQYHAETLTDDYSTEEFTQFTKTVPNSSSAWNAPYERIRMANIMLSRIDRVEGMPAEAADHWRGVARFFRALYHYNLVRTYGDVVWVDAEVDFAKEEEITRPRDSRVVVMDNVVADLQFAAAHCYAPAKTGNAVNNMVAQALLSRVALYEAAWEKYHNVAGGHPATFYKVAKDAAKAVIDSGLYTVTDNYKGMYTSLSLADSQEVIMYKHYTLANVNGGKVTAAHSQYGWINSSTPTWGLTKSAVENYACADGIPVHMKGAAYSDATVEGVFTGRDARLAATVKDDVLPVVELPYTGNTITATTGYWAYKFLDMSQEETFKKLGTWNAPSNDTDGPIFQYSEVLENYAEACAELNQISQNDLDISVNLLRVRHGGMPALTLAGDGCTVNGTAITKDPNDPAANVLLQELRRDRRSELMTDGFRHDDLMRWALGKNLDTKLNEAGYVGASKAAIKALADKASADWAEVEKKNFFTKSGYKSPYNTAAVAAGDGAVVDRIWDDKYYLEPIPAGQILLDDKLTQNPGW